jgi:hypothetical protein
VRAQQPVQSHRVDTQQPAFTGNAPRLGGGGGGGGALDPITVLLIAAGVLSPIAHARVSKKHRC